MKTHRSYSIHKNVEIDEDIKQAPKFNIGEWAVIYSGRNEGHKFEITDFRWNYDINDFEFLYRIAYGGWFRTGQLRRIVAP